MVQIVIPAPAIKCELASRLFRENIQPPSLQHEFGKDQLCGSFTTDGGDIFIQKTPSPDDGHMRINWNRSALFFRAASCFGWTCRVVHCVRLYGFGFVAGDGKPLIIDVEIDYHWRNDIYPSALRFDIFPSKQILVSRNC